MGQPVTYTATFTLGPGENFAYAFFTFDPWPSPIYSCKIGVATSFNGNQPGVYMHDDQGNPMPTMSFLSNAAPESSTKCSVNPSGSNVVQTGSNVTVTILVTFLGNYNGARFIWLDLYDQNNNTTWLNVGQLSTSGGPFTSPQIISVSPAVGISRSTDVQAFKVKVRDIAGGLSIWHLEFMFSQGNQWQYGYQFAPSQRCKIVSESNANLWWMEDPAQGVNSQVSPATGPGPIVSSSLCTFYTQFSEVEQLDENTVQVTFAVQFPNPSFSGFLQMHAFAADDTGQAGSGGWHSTWDTPTTASPFWNPTWWSWYAWPDSNPPSVPTSFSTCIPSAGANCTLQPYQVAGNYVPYLVMSGSLPDVASNVTINGCSSATPCALQRDPRSTDLTASLLNVPAGVSGVNINGLAILGNRYGLTPDTTLHNYQTIPPANTNLPITLNSNDTWLLNWQCDVPGIQACVDLNIDGSAINVSNSYLYDAPAHSVEIAQDSSNVQVSGGEIDNSHLTGVLVYSNGFGPPQNGYSECSSSSQYQVPGIPNNIRVMYVTFRNHSTGAISFGNIQTYSAIGNSIYDHQLDPDSNEQSGGAIVDFECTLGGTISNNTIDDSNVGIPGAQGMELHGMNQLVQNNVVQNIPGPGIYLDATCGTSIAGNTVYNTSQHQQQTVSGSGAEFQTGGLEIADEDPSANPRPAQDINVSNVNAYNNLAGLAILALQGSQFANITIENNCNNPPPYNNPSAFSVVSVLGPQPSGVNIVGSNNNCSQPSLPVVTCSRFH